MSPVEDLRAAWAALVADTRVRGAAFGRAAASLLDDALGGVLGDAPGIALVSLGSYARRELCPGSDVDLLLLSAGRRPPPPEVAGAVWYPLWDAGFTLGHATRSLRDAVRLADTDLDTLTAMLDARLVAGDVGLATELAGKVARLARQRQKRLLGALAAGARTRRADAIAERLEPSLKGGGGGLRDLQALSWAGSVLERGGGWDALVRLGYLHGRDRDRLAIARDVLLDVRIALHRCTGGRGDVLRLQEQDGVARLLGDADADELARRIAAAAHDVAWISLEAWDRLAATEAGPGRRAGADVVLAPGVVRRDSRIAVPAAVPVDTKVMLEAAAIAAELGLPIERATLDACASVDTPPTPWPPPDRDAFLRILRAGRGMVPVVEALTHVGAMTRLVPEWETVRARPQRNAYHRFTVDRHLLETVAECAALLDDPGHWPECGRPDLLLLGAFFHDFAKGAAGDHSESGADLAEEMARRLGYEDDDAATLAWLVRNHLALAETATRRDLSDPATIRNTAEMAGNVERLRLLCLLTVGDSRATGPAAWGPVKAALVRELWVKCEAALSGGDSSALDAERAAALQEHALLLAAREVALRWSDAGDGLLECVVAAPDRTGLLAAVAGVLALAGFDVREASGYSTEDGMALEVFRGYDRHDRLDAVGRSRVERELCAALAGELAVADRLGERIRRYRRGPSAVRVVVDRDASDDATVVEVHATDAVGLLARVAGVFAGLGLDVTVARVATLGADVVDVFYVRDAAGAPLTDTLTIDRLRATLLARLTSEYALP